MTRSPLPDSDADLPGGLQAALSASGVVGVWLHDIWADRLVVSDAVAVALGVPPEAGLRGIPLATLLARTHEDDRARVDNALHAAIARGGAFAIAFRTAHAPRRLDLRGRIEADAAGRPARARGIVLDLTEEPADDPRDQHAVNRMAEHAIALRGLADALARPGLSRLLDHLMIEIGHELARHLRDAPDGQRH
ncbi:MULTISPECIES: PAS domain-containing protein [unclassified Methylobacterium]|uniref:PAS domain-containing protein n=1 Tax=unclassified Methylobacterium TaxID=2615210 RepID=UPI0007009E2A|nr:MULTISPECIES: PAS domain-containing protein [unclassified Methylobacterium]KQP89021.1 hypothetical protein ASF60_19985 [Methylobacterium sp. Leaf113]MCK2055662.1 PAS domain-containing protein [Methylobacterium sp. 37f]